MRSLILAVFASSLCASSAAWAGVTPRHHISGTSGRRSTPITKVGATRSYGAEIVLAGASYNDAYEHALQLAHQALG